MKKRLTGLMAVALIGCGFKNIQAQQAMGLIAGNHNATYSAFQNPANTYSDRNRVYINFWGAQLGFTNNYLTYNAPFGLIRMAEGDYPDAYDNGGKLGFDQDWLQWERTNTQKLYYLNEVYGPSMAFRLSRRTAMGFGIRGISGLSMDGVGPEMGRLIRYGLDSAGLGFNGNGANQRDKQYSNGAFNIATESYQEWYFSLAGVTKDRGHHFVKWGGNAKLLLGMGAAGISGDALDFSVSSADKLNLTYSNVKFQHTDDESASGTLANPLGLNFNEVNGIGAGMDLGFVYEYRPDLTRKKVNEWWNCKDELRNDYAWKFGASITDFGFIAYEGSQRLLKSGSKSWQINRDIVNNYNFAQGDDRFDKVDKGFFDDSAIQADINDRFANLTPAAFNAQLDLNLKNNFYIGLNWQQSLKGAGSAGLKKASYVSVVPRWEKESAEIGVPITLTRDYSSLNVGLYGRIGPVIVGTDNLAGLASFVGNGSYKNANVYFALRLQIAACGRSNYEHWYYDTTLKADTVVTKDTLRTSDTTNFWRVDTVYREKIVRDTVRIHKTDTVIKYKNSEVGPNPDAKNREEALSKREAELKKKEEDLKKREALVVQKEKENGPGDMSTATDCTKRINELEDQLKKERDLYAKLNAQYQVSRDEVEAQKVKIANLEKEITRLKTEYNNLVIENNSLKVEIDKLRAEITRLKTNNKPCDAQVKTLDSLLAIEQAKNIELLKENSKQKAEVTASKKESEDQKKRIAELEAEIAKLKANTTDKAASEKAIKDLEAQLAAEKAKSSGLQSQLDELRKEYQHELEKVKSLQEQLKNCGNAEELAKLKAELEAQKKKCDELSEKLKAAEADKAALSSENSTLKAKVTGLEKDLNDLKAKLDAETKKVAELTEKLKNCGSGEESAALKAEIEALKKSNSEKDAQITGLKNDKAKLESELSTAKAKITDLENQLKECSSKDCGELEAQLADWKSKYETLKNQHDVLGQEYNALLTERNQLKSKLADCEQKLKNCTGSSEDISKLEAEITKLKQTIGALTSELDAKQKSMDDLQEAYDKLEGEKVALQKQVSGLQAQITSLNKQVADLEAQLKECQDSKQAPGGEGGGN